MGYYVETTAPTKDILSIQDARRHCKIDDTLSDIELQSFLWAALVKIQEDMRLSILPRTMTAYFDGFSDPLKLIWGPLAAVSSVKYFDADDAEQTVSASDYYVASYTNARFKIVPKTSWPATKDGRPNSVIVEFTCGYAAVPENIKQAARLLVGHYYENREAVIVGTIGSELPMAYNSLVGILRDVAV